MRTSIPFALVAVLALGACKKKEEGEKKDKDKPAPAKQVDAAAQGGEPLSHKAGWCPSTVAGSTTTLDKDASKDGKVVLTVTGADEAAVTTIRARVKHLMEVQDKGGDKVEHTGAGTGGGDAGVCPVITRDATFTSEDVEGGVRITMTAAGDGAALLGLVEKRVDEAKAWLDANIKQEGAYGESGGDGGGKGGHGGNRSGKGDASGNRTGGDHKGKGDGKGPGDGSGPGDQTGQ